MLFAIFQIVYKCSIDDALEPHLLVPELLSAWWKLTFHAHNLYFVLTVYDET